MKFLASCVVALLFGAPAIAQPQPPLQDAPPAKRYELPNTEVHLIRSESLGREYPVYVWLPPSYAASPSRRYPVIFTTDAPQSFPLMTGLHRRLRASERGMADAIIVGLGYAVGDTPEYSRRRDYTPSIFGDIDARSDMPGRPVKYGEAEAYRRHLKDDVFPFLEARFRIDPAKRIYAGHSYGGLFGTHVLFADPQMFSRYILMSPSLWYGRRHMLAQERAHAAANRDLPAEVYFMIGSEETVPDPDTEPFSTSRMAMVEDMEEMVKMLKSRNYPSLKVQSRIFDGEDHGSVYPAAIRAGMEWAIAGTGKRPHVPCEVPGCRLPWQTISED